MANQTPRGIGILILAHIQTDHLLGRPEQQLGKTFRYLGLAGTGWPGEQKHPNRPGRVGQSRLQHRNAFNEAVYGLVLAYYATRECFAKYVYVESLPFIQHVFRQTGYLAQRTQDVNSAKRLIVITLLRPHCSESQQAQNAARKTLVGQILLRELQCFGNHFVSLMVRKLVVEPVK